ncbi:hypothetical protein BU24DRAFT_418691 [Aaosphaeria arxii CBS 175.79]|uniref:Uncharacterized protein n=1 Tax=Aaosphaeria arxii CBS 175.79 TaxID=1450172 RepID=A0A6A5Y1E3_9PLEO|nr:uncharacterized protein BU24DRAFT_418691 [Aaosphaeria arxii CBS 175.79]KAF2019089.1 hypothetical protein BU24DRAFT_418691 [Aaosphaeria arxii CBS 175.79]
MRASVIVPAFALAAFAQDASSVASSVASAASSAASVAVSSFTGDAFPQTSFLTQTDSRGVVTGQPAVETSIPNQPAASLSIPPVATSVGVPASIPAVGTGVHTIPVAGPNNSTRTLIVSANNSTTIILNEGTSAASGSGSSATTTGGSRPSGSGASGSGATGATGTGAPQSTPNNANIRVAAGGLVGAGMFVAAFL